MRQLKRIIYFFSLLWRVIDERKPYGKKPRNSAKTSWKVATDYIYGDQND
jgi:hypothetical protein